MKNRKLSKKQRQYLLKLIAEGRDSGEINKLCQKYKESFSVTKQRVDYYRQRYVKPFRETLKKSDESALANGFAVKEKRIEILNALAEKLQYDLFEEGLIWLNREKCLGGAVNGKFIIESEFNETEISQFRGILDDIAKEMGERKPKEDANSNNVEIKIYSGFDPDKV